MIWREPMSRVAVRFGVSDVTLRRICERHEIPRPTPGHWSKLAYGKTIERPPLPDGRFSPDDPVRFSAPTLRVVAWLTSALTAGFSVLVAIDV